MLGKWDQESSKAVGRITLPVYHLDGKTAKARILQSRLERVRGIESAYVSLSTEMAYVVYDPQQISPAAVRQSVERLDAE